MKTISRLGLARNAFPLSTRRRLTLSYFLQIMPVRRSISALLKPKLGHAFRHVRTEPREACLIGVASSPVREKRVEMSLSKAHWSMLCSPTKTFSAFR